MRMDLDQKPGLWLRVCNRKLIFLFSQPKRMLWVLKRTIIPRWFFWASKTYAKNYGQENIYNFALQIFVYPTSNTVFYEILYETNMKHF